MLILFFKNVEEKRLKKAKTSKDRRIMKNFINKQIKDIDTSNEMIEAAKSRLKELNKMKTKDLKEALNRQYEETQKRRDAEDAKYEREQAKLAERFAETSKVIRKHFDNKENKKAFVNAVYKDLKDMLGENDMDIKKDADYIEWSWIESSINNVMQDTFSLDEHMRSYELREDYLEDVYDDLYDEVRDKIRNS